MKLFDARTNLWHRRIKHMPNAVVLCWLDYGFDNNNQQIQSYRKVAKVSFADKSPAIQNFLEDVFGTGTAIKEHKCVLCGEDAEAFRDSLSEKEYGISGMCQSCQDDVFGGESNG